MDTIRDRARERKQYNRKSNDGIRLQQRVQDRYVSKLVEDARRPIWAMGCPNCTGGLLKPVPEYAHIPAPLYVARIAQASMGILKFCECDAGRAYQIFLRKKYKDIVAKRDVYPNWDGIAQAAANPPATRRGG